MYLLPTPERRDAVASPLWLQPQGDHPQPHKCGERFVNIQLNVVLFGGGINIYALGLQSRNKTVRARLGNDNDSRTSGLESDEASKGVKKRCFVGIELNLIMAEGLALLRCR